MEMPWNIHAPLDSIKRHCSWPPAQVEHTVFMLNADGYYLPALQEVCAFRLSGVYGLPGDLYQMQAAGHVRYDAFSAPLIWDELKDADSLRAGNTGSQGSRTRDGSIESKPRSAPATKSP